VYNTNWLHLLESRRQSGAFQRRQSHLLQLAVFVARDGRFPCRTVARWAQPFEAAAVSQAIHDVAVLVEGDPGTAQTMHPTAAVVALESMLARCHQLVANSARTDSLENFHVNDEYQCNVSIGAMNESYIVDFTIATYERRMLNLYPLTFACCQTN